MITVVIPSHNRVDELKRALYSVYVQSVKPSEIIVVDDGSSPQVENSIFENCPEEITVKLLRNEIPRGANHARNRGIKAASGEWIAFLDDDDEFFSSKIKVISECINHHDDLIDVVYHPAKIHMVNENISYLSSPKKFKKNEDVFRQLLINNHIGGTPMVIVKRSSLIKVGLFDEELPELQDYELWLRLAKNGCKFHLVDIPLTHYYHRTKDNSITTSSSANEEAYQHIEKKYSEDYAKLNIDECNQYEMRKVNRLVRKSYLNKNYLNSIILNLKAFIRFKKISYLNKALASLLGPSFIFWVRSWSRKNS